MTSPPSALAGVRVLDLSRVLAGPSATQVLGDLGAEVIKIERPGEGDDTRAWGPPFLRNEAGEVGDAVYFLAANRNKKSVAVDFAHPEGAAIIKRLAASAHIVVENFKTGGLAKYGLDYPSLSAANPALVYCSITGFGQTGPYAKRAGYDYMIQAMSGLMSLTGDPQGEPMKSAVAVADLFTGLYGVIGMLAALRHAERTGQGQHVDMALLDCQVAALSYVAGNFLATGRDAPRIGNNHLSIAPYQVFSTSDGHIVVAVGNDHQFAAFCSALGLNLHQQEAYAENEARIANRAAMNALLAPPMTTKTTAEWIGVLEKVGVPCGPINTISQMFADPQAKARGLSHVMRRSDGAAVNLVASPLKLSATPAEPRLPPPLLGEHTDAVLRDLLRASEVDIAQWRASGAIG